MGSKIYGLLILFLLVLNCKSVNTPIKKNIYWVHSAKLNCTGVGKMRCLQIQKREHIDYNANWELFYSQIEGFEYQPGFIYKLNVTEQVLLNPPADGSSIKYTLIEILEKKQDLRYNIHDIYILKSIGGKEINVSKLKEQPTLEINISKMQIFGNNGCNNFSGSISIINESQIKFGPIAETKMYCQNMDIPNKYSSGITATRSFNKDQNELHFMNDSNKTVLTFKKID